ncbi:hypothetical protein U472_11335 [Orenia metallireducens]|uniref:LysM domain-containing protein n=1 Tax=Orenia metallireducens TaxID=1413210 RepID=A0A1C0A8H8_9FIRM|nr:LysM domain-containing protein [Orenia metallireducens]OCL26573.1 hypothetical protein U472_11335 [Orenia metallireducens]
MGDYRRYQQPPRRGRCPRGAREYIVRAGDTFYSIAGYFNTTVDELMRLNPDINPDRLRAGQIICVPARGRRRGSCPYY